MKRITFLITLFCLSMIICHAQSSDDAKYEQATNYYKAKEYKKALPILKELADKNHAKALNLLGVFYNYGYSVPKNIQKAVELYQKSASLGWRSAQRNLGDCYKEGEGVPKNMEKAYSWYEKAFRQYKELAEKGDADAQSSLGYAYYEGEGIEKNEEMAVYWWKKAAEKGDDVAQANLGNCFSKGEGIEKNEEMAVYWWKKAAEKGNSQAQYNLGYDYSKGEGIEKNEEMAVYWWKKAANNNRNAQNDLGYAYFYGKGVEMDIGRAIFWWKKAAENGHKLAQNNLALSYFNGDGVEKDFNMAIYWWKKAAESGHPDAQSIIGTAYFNGEGVEVDVEKAIYWWKKAAENGNKLAKKRLVSISSEDGSVQSHLDGIWISMYFNDKFFPMMILSVSSNGNSFALKKDEKDGSSSLGGCFPLETNWAETIQEVGLNRVYACWSSQKLNTVNPQIAASYTQGVGNAANGLRSVGFGQSIKTQLTANIAGESFQILGDMLYKSLFSQSLNINILETEFTKLSDHELAGDCSFQVIRVDDSGRSIPNRIINEQGILFVKYNPEWEIPLIDNNKLMYPDHYLSSHEISTLKNNNTILGEILKEGKYTSKILNSLSIKKIIYYVRKELQKQGIDIESAQKEEMDHWVGRLGCELKEIDNGVVINKVFRETYAYLQGIKKGDKILSIDGYDVNVIDDIYDYVNSMEPFSTVTLELQRGKKIIKKTVGLSPYSLSSNSYDF